MSDGGKEIKRGIESNAGFRDGPNDYARAVAKVAVAQVCEEVGFECLKGSAVEALSDVAVRFMCDAGRSAGSYATLAGRAECNVFDILKALEDLGSTTGFSGPLELGNCPVGSGVANGIIEFVQTKEEIPFAQPIPRFPVIKRRRGMPSFSQMGETPGGKHIPDWLPAFPDPHTYIHSPMWNGKRTDPQAEKLEQARQRRKAEKSLLNLQQRLLLSSAAGPSGLHTHVDTGQQSSTSYADVMKDPVAPQKSDSFLAPPLEAPQNHNPFFAPPFPAEENDAASIVSPVRFKRKEEDMKKHTPLLEIFAPAIDAIRSGETKSMSSNSNGLLDRTPVVHFKLKGSRRMVFEDLDTCLRDRSNKRNSLSLVRRDDRDEKKRRAEIILRQSMGQS